MLEGFDNQSIGAVAPQLARALHLTGAMLGPVFSASTLGMLTGAAVGGRVADLIGVRRVLSGSVALFGLFSIATAYAWDAQTLFAARLFTGLGIGGALPSVIAMVSASVRPERRGAIVSATYAGLPLGGAVAAWLSGRVAEGSWPLVFLAGGAAPLVIAPALWFALPRGVRTADVAPPPLPVLRVLFGQGRAVATLLIWASFFLTLVILYLLLDWLPILMTSRGYDPHTVADVQVAFNLAGGLGCLVSGLLLDGRWRRPFVVAVYLGLAAGLAALALFTPPAAVEIALGGLAGAGILLAQAVLYDAGSRLYEAPIRATGLGAAVSAGRVGSVAGPLLGAVLLARTGSSADVLLWLVPFAVLSGLTSGLLVWRGRGADLDPAPGPAAEAT